MKLLDDTEDWLYGEGEDETKTVYQERLADMKVHVCWHLLEGWGGGGWDGSSRSNGGARLIGKC